MLRGFAEAVSSSSGTLLLIIQQEYRLVLIGTVLAWINYVSLLWSCGSISGQSFRKTQKLLSKTRQKHTRPPLTPSVTIWCTPGYGITGRTLFPFFFATNSHFFSTRQKSLCACVLRKNFSRILSSQDVVVVVVVAVVGIGTQKKTELKPKPIEPKNLSSGAGC